MLSGNLDSILISKNPSSLENVELIIFLFLTNKISERAIG